MLEKIKAFRHCFSDKKPNCEGCVYENTPEQCEELTQTIQDIMEKCGEIITFEHIHNLAKFLFDIKE